MPTRISFRLAKHGILEGVQIVEILADGTVCAVIYPQDEREIKLVSAHIDGEVAVDDGTTSSPPIPSISVRFDPKPYRIVGRRIIKLPQDPQKN